MGWSIGYDSTFDRFIGYAVPAKCEHPDCDEDIDRGVSYVCGSDPYGGDHGCGLHFCEEHLWMVDVGNRTVQLCERCKANAQIDWDTVSGAEMAEPFTPKPDTLEWQRWQLTDESWAKWRDENPEKVSAIRSALA